MEENRMPDFIFKWLMSLNLMIILYIAVLMALSLTGYVHENTALLFIQQVKSLPLVPWKIPAAVLLLYGSLMAFLQLRNENSALFYAKTGLEMIIAVIICFLLGFSYTGIILLILADVTRRFPGARRKFAAIGVICVFYLFMDYNLLSDRYGVISLEVCLGYYSADAKAVMLGARNILNSLNILLFIIYVILLMREQMSEKERILSLNEKLNQANEELHRANIQMEEYARESIKNAQTKERNRLAREIHDTLGHTLTGIITGLDACITLTEAAPEAAKEQLKVIADVARNGMTDVRRSVKALRPDALEKMELEKALVNMIEEMRKATHAQIEYNCTARLKNFNEDEEEIIYRIVQESITNAIRHGKADRIWITISMEYHMLTIKVQDNGKGCKKIEKGFGLHHMEERLSMLHGSLSCNGENGFMLEAKIPIRWGEEA